MAIIFQIIVPLFLCTVNLLYATSPSLRERANASGWADQTILKRKDVIISLVLDYNLKPNSTYDKKGKTLNSLLLSKTESKDVEKKIHTYLSTQFFPKSEEINDEQLLRELETKNPEQKEFINCLKGSLEKIRDNYEKFTKLTESDFQNQFTQCKNSKINNDAQMNKYLAFMMVVCNKTHEYVPRNTQIIAVLCHNNLKNEKGNFVQVNTGEGKSLIIAMTAALYAAQGKFVDIVSSSSVLSERDAIGQKGFYKALGITSGTTHEGDKNILYSTMLDLQAGFLGGKRLGKKERSFDILILDEVDSTLVDMSHLRTQLTTYIPGMEYFFPLYYVMQQNNKMERNDFINTVRKAIRGEILGVSIPIPERLKFFAEYQVPIWVDNAIKSRSYRHDVSYLVDDSGTIKLVDYEHTGVVQSQMTLSDGLHQFLQSKHLGYLTPEMLMGQFISNGTYIKKYEKIYGVSGTLGGEITKDHMNKTYNATNMIIPTAFPKRFFQYKTAICKNEKLWLEEIYQRLERELKRGRSILLLVESISEVKKLQDFLENKAFSTKHKRYEYARNDIEVKQAEKIPDPLVPGAIILATNLAGRGTDLKIDTELEKNGGIHVCITFPPMNDRVEAQGLGRTARQGQKGTGNLIIHEGQLIKQKLLYFGEQNDDELVSKILSRRNATIQDSLIQKYCIERQEYEMRDGFYTKFHEFLETVFQNHYNKPFFDQQISAIKELWSLQYHLIQHYQETVYEKQESSLISEIKNYGLESCQTQKLTPNLIYEMVSEFISTADTPVYVQQMKHQIMMFLWSQSSHKKEDFKNLLGNTINGSDEIFKSIAKVYKLTFVIIDQKGGIQTYCGQNDYDPKKVMIIGKLLGGPSAQDSFQIPAHLIEHYALNTEDGIFDALAHQLYFTENNPKKDPLYFPDISQKIKEKILKQDDLKDITSTELLRRFSEIRSDIILSYSYTEVQNESTQKKNYYYDGKKYTKKSDLPKKAPKLFIKIGYNGLHYTSIIQEKSDTGVSCSILPCVFDTQWYYRKNNKQLVYNKQPGHLLPRYGTVDFTEDSNILDKLFSNHSRDKLESMVGGYPALDESSETFKTLYELYESVVHDFYKTHFEEEKKYVDPIVKIFTTECESLIKSGSLIFSPDSLMKLVNKEPKKNEQAPNVLMTLTDKDDKNNQESPKEIEKQFIKSIGVEPLLHYITYYGLTHLVVKYNLEIDQKTHKHAENFLKTVMASTDYFVAFWTHIVGMSSGRIYEDNGEKTYALLEQAKGRISWIKALLENASKNIKMIQEFQHTLRIGSASSWQADFANMGVHKKDEENIRRSGVCYFYSLIDEPPKPSCLDIISMGFLGIIQSVAGVAMITTGFGASIGSTLLSEGLSDIYTAISSIATDKCIDWMSYWIGKGVTACMTFIGAAWEAFQMTAEEVAKSGKTLMERTIGKVVGETGDTCMKKSGEIIAGNVLGSVISQSSSAVANIFTQNCMKKFAEDIKDAAAIRIKKITDDAALSKKLLCIQAYDYARNNGCVEENNIIKKMGKWAEGNFRKLSGFIKQAITAADSAHRTKVTKGAYMAIHIYDGINNFTKAVTFCENYVTELGEKISEAYAQLIKHGSITSTLNVFLKNEGESKKLFHTIQDKYLYFIKSEEIQTYLSNMESYIEASNISMTNEEGKGVHNFFSRLVDFYKDKAEIYAPNITKYWHNLITLFTNELNVGSVGQVRDVLQTGISKIAHSLVDKFKFDAIETEINKLETKAELSPEEQVELAEKNMALFRGKNEVELFNISTKEKKDITSEEQDKLAEYNKLKDDLTRAKETLLPPTEFDQAGVEIDDVDFKFHDSFSDDGQSQAAASMDYPAGDDITTYLQSLTHPQEKMDVLSHLYGISTAPPTVESLNTTPTVIVSVDTFIHEKFTNIGETYGELQRAYPDTFKVLKGTLEWALDVAMVTRVINPYVLSGTVGMMVADATGLTGWVKNHITEQLKNLGLTKSCDKLSAGIMLAVESKAASKISNGARNSTAFSTMVKSATDKPLLRPEVHLQAKKILDKKGNLTSEAVGKAQEIKLNGGIKNTAAGHPEAAAARINSKWKIENYDKVVQHPKFGKIYRDPKTDLWWSKDTGVHGGSQWKVFEEKGKGLQWFKDADQYGTYLTGKHKGPVGRFIPWKDLGGKK